MSEVDVDLVWIYEDVDLPEALVGEAAQGCLLLPLFTNLLTRQEPFISVAG
jgi:hypothetical protein